MFTTHKYVKQYKVDSSITTLTVHQNYNKSLLKVTEN